ncbi:hypothetical protein [Ramlibacter albus]|uniref:NUDIX hydrolase n=1 Tax=Ramlibacter albus TaxID=2079448 RepID=A0A923M5I5_9BURK|nr:hypothetical protein [Ramlibacter albus]MBC5763209.1 hypothetical protein [Ramlibacter albus]
MPKHYVLPIDSNGNGLFPIKQRLNPYTNESWFCGGCPQLFGGTDQGGMMETLYRETQEESHLKVDLTGDDIFYHLVHTHGEMSFYVCTKFAYNPDAYFPKLLSKQNKYRETTGEIFTIDMSDVPTDTRQNAAVRWVEQYHVRSGGRRPPELSIAQLMLSETAEAFRLAAETYQSGDLRFPI